MREVLPAAKIALGGGFAGNHLRNLKEPAVCEFVDYIVLDAGERPLICLLEHLKGRRPLSGLHRIWMRENGQVRYWVRDDLADIPQALTGYPNLRVPALGLVLFDDAGAQRLRPVAAGYALAQA